MIGDAATKAWYDEINDHDFDKDYQNGTGHFTQVVWKETNEVGFGIAKSSNGSFYVVANYYPAGNFMNKFKENVPRKQ
jgi:glioma pathogenesis-related protein 2